LNPEQRLNDVEKAINSRPSSPTGCYFICWKDGNIFCFPTMKIPNPDLIIFRASENHIMNGFTAREWMKIRQRLESFDKALKT